MRCGCGADFEIDLERREALKLEMRTLKSQSIPHTVTEMEDIDRAKWMVKVS